MEGHTKTQTRKDLITPPFPISMIPKFFGIFIIGIGLPLPSLFWTKSPIFGTFFCMASLSRLHLAVVFQSLWRYSGKQKSPCKLNRLSSIVSLSRSQGLEMCLNLI